VGDEDVHIGTMELLREAGFEIKEGIVQVEGPNYVTVSGEEVSPE